MWWHTIIGVLAALVLDYLALLRLLWCASRRAGGPMRMREGLRLLPDLHAWVMKGPASPVWRPCGRFVPRTMTVLLGIQTGGPSRPPAIDPRCRGQ
jgi:hypothetical protein